MADENIRTGTNEGDDDPLADQLTEGQQSAFLDEEELNDQRPGDAEGEDLTSLTAAHQGSRSTLANNSAAFTPADGNLLDEGSELIGSQTSSADRASGTTLAGNSPDAIQGNLDLELSVGDGDSAPNAQERGGGQGTATAAERSSGETAGDTVGATTGANANDELQFSGGDADQAGSNGLASNGTADEDPTLEFDLSGEAGSGFARNDDGLGGSGDQDSPVSSGDDVVEYVEEDTATTSNGNSDIVGDKFDNNLVGTGNSETINAKGGDDTLFGGAGDDNLMGKQGNDSLDGGTGADTLSGGGGDDLLIWDSADTEIDGGTGTDTLRVDAGDADFTTFGGSITNIETIDLQSDTGANTVTLSAQNVLDMTDSGNTLTITGDGGDILEAAAAGPTAASTATATTSIRKLSEARRRRCSSIPT